MDEISETRNLAWIRWKATAIEWLSVIIAGAAVMLALLSMFVNAICIGIIWSQESHIDELAESVSIYRIRAAKMDAWLKANGIPTETIYDEPSR